MTRRTLTTTLATLALALAFAITPANAHATTWPTWGNNEIADCAFAAAANWETLALGYTPNEAQIIREFYEAGGNTQNGLSEHAFAHWWKYHGIGGVRVSLHEVRGEDALEEDPKHPQLEMLPQSAVRRFKQLIHKYHYLLDNINWGGSHEVVITGYNATGPTMVSWGETQQWTWNEWRNYSWGLYIPTLIAHPSATPHPTQKSTPAIR